MSARDVCYVLLYLHSEKEEEKVKEMVAWYVLCCCWRFSCFYLKKYYIFLYFFSAVTVSITIQAAGAMSVCLVFEVAAASCTEKEVFYRQVWLLTLPLSASVNTSTPDVSARAWRDTPHHHRHCLLTCSHGYNIQSVEQSCNSVCLYLLLLTIQLL